MSDRMSGTAVPDRLGVCQLMQSDLVRMAHASTSGLLRLGRMPRDARLESWCHSQRVQAVVDGEDETAKRRAGTTWRR